MTEIRFHLELPGGSTWKGDAIQDLALIGLFAGVGGHNIHIQTFPGFEMHEMQKNMQVAETLCTKPTLNAQTPTAPPFKHPRLFK